MSFIGNKSGANRISGFSLIELLIVIAIILIIAAIAIPNLLRARIAANEGSATNSIRNINTAEFAYNAAYPTSGYATAITNLGGAAPCTPSPITACILDNALASAAPGSAGKSGYVFRATGLFPTGAMNVSFVSAGAPLIYNITGVRGFCATEDGVIRFTGSSPGPPVATMTSCQAFTVMQ
jgi:prepilin-type N-terminal cleavage/methylation domain-containing protein